MLLKIWRFDKVVDVEFHVKFKNKYPCSAKKREKLSFSCITLFLLKYIIVYFGCLVIPLQVETWLEAIKNPSYLLLKIWKPVSLSAKNKTNSQQQQKNTPSPQPFF